MSTFDFSEQSYGPPHEGFVELTDALEGEMFAFTDLGFDATGEQWTKGHFEMEFVGKQFGEFDTFDEENVAELANSFREAADSVGYFVANIDVQRVYAGNEWMGEIEAELMPKNP